MLVRSLGLNQQGTSAAFKDVAAKDWFFGAVAAATDAKIVNGFADSTFHPLEPISREEMAAMTLRALEYTGHTSSAGNEDAILDSYKDNSSIGAWARKPIAELMTSQIMNGMTGNQIAPKALATRAQAVTILKQALQSIQLINE
ncbi:Endo-1,4-beta-xylanase A precursor [compost metagenome]